MRKRLCFWPVLMYSILLFLVTACGSPVTSTPTSSTPVPLDGEHLYVLDGYPASGKEIEQRFFIIPAKSNVTKTLALPAGLMSQDHQQIYTATPQQDGQTLITITDVLTGQTLRSLSIAGTYTTAGQLYTDALLSYNGAWLALRQLGQPTTETTIAIIDTKAGKLTKTIKLKGEFELDAISPDGERLYLLEQFRSQNYYEVRYYEVAKNELHPGAIVDKNEPDERMVGLPSTRQMSLDGDIAYTLYTNIQENKAFVHILSLRGDLTTARCLDLEGGKSPDLLRYYTLALSTDGRTLYAINGALGLVTKIPLTRDVFDINIDKTERFEPGQTNRTGEPFTLYNGAVLSTDQKILYTPGISGILAIDAQTLKLQKTYLPEQTFTSLAISASGKMLYGVHPESGVTMLDLISGKPQQITGSPANAPWGIECVTGP